MDDAAVVAGLVPGRAVLFFQYRNLQAGIALQEVVGGGKADDAGTDDGDVLRHDKLCAAQCLLFGQVFKPLIVKHAFGKYNGPCSQKNDPNIRWEGNIALIPNL
jgi:hypothetical protein